MGTVVSLPATQTRIEKNVTYVTKPIVAERVIEVPQVQYRDHVVEDRQTIVMEKVIHVPRTEIQERVVEVPRHVTREVLVDVPQVQVIEKFVEVPTPVFQERIIPVVRPIIEEKTIHVPKPVIREKIVEIPRVYYKPVTVEKVVEVPDYRIEYKYRDVPVPQKILRHVPVEHIKHVPQVRYVEKFVKKPEIRTHYVPPAKNVQELPMQHAVPRRVPIAPPARPVAVFRADQSTFDSLMESLFACCTPRAHNEVSAPQGVSRRQLRLSSARCAPVNVDVAVMPRNQQRRRHDCCGLLCAPDVKDTQKQTLRPSYQQFTDATRILTPSRHEIRAAPAPVNLCAMERVIRPSEHPSLEQSYLVLPEVISPRWETVDASQSSRTLPEPVIQTKFGPMPFHQFEKLNNEDSLVRGLRPAVPATPTTQAGSSNGTGCSPLRTVDEVVVKTQIQEIQAAKQHAGGDTDEAVVATCPAEEGNEDSNESLRVISERMGMQTDQAQLLAEQLRLYQLAEERQMQLLELKQQQRLIRLQAQQQPATYEAQQQAFKQEQEQLREELRRIADVTAKRQMGYSAPSATTLLPEMYQAEATADDVLIQTRYGPMKFREFEKLNNDNALRCTGGVRSTTCSTVAHSPLVLTPRAQCGKPLYSALPLAAYSEGPAFPLTAAASPAAGLQGAAPKQPGPHMAARRCLHSATQRMAPAYQMAHMAMYPRLCDSGGLPGYPHVEQALYVQRNSQVFQVIPYPVYEGAPPANQPPTREDILDERYKGRISHMARLTAQNSVQAGVSVYESIRSLVHGEN